MTTITHGNETRTKPGRRQKHSTKRDHFAFHHVILSKSLLCRPTLCGREGSRVIPHSFAFSSTRLYSISSSRGESPFNCSPFVPSFSRATSSSLDEVLSRSTVLFGFGFGFGFVLSTRKRAHRVATLREQQRRNHRREMYRLVLKFKVSHLCQVSP